MPSLDEQIAQLESAIAAQEAQRATLGDAVVEVTVKALRTQLDALRSQRQGTEQPLAPSTQSPEELLARLQSYLPPELAAKMRATGRIEGERKLVTVLFADISGFTALSESLDPEIVTTMTSESLKELAEAVYQYEGYIDKFIGDAIMAVFGAPVAHEDDPERALRAALAMRERLENVSRRWSDRLGQPLTLHIGVNTGPVVAGNVGPDLRLSYTVMGATVNTASRLENAAVPGQILVSHDTYRLTREAFTFDELEPIKLKGKREPLAVYKLRRAALHPTKTRGLKDLGTAFVGRDRELGQLRQVLRELKAGRGRIVTIAGEAGLGKSRLMAEWRKELGKDMRYREGRAFEYTKGLAYGPFLDLFRGFAEIKDEDSESEARARLDAAVSLIFGDNLDAHALFANLLGMGLSKDEATLIASLSAQALRQKLFDLIERAFEHRARERPGILVLEDVHWADTASLELVEHLLPLTERLPVAIVAVFRPQTEEPLTKLLSAIQTRYASRATFIELPPLSEDSTIAMVKQLLATPRLSANLRSLILDKAEGNPFFVEEVIRTLIDRGALVRANGRGWVVTPLIESITVPDTLQGLLMARLDRLPDETKWVAQQASVIGRIFPYRVLLQVCESNAVIDADLRHLEREDLIRERARDPELEYIFKHALTQEVAYQSLLAPRRKELHHKVGEAMENLFAERLSEYYSVIGEHLKQGEAWNKAADYQIKAGDAAERLYAHAEARQHYAAALDALSHLPDAEDNRRRRVDTVTKLVRVSWVAVDPKINLDRLGEAEALLKTLLSNAGAIPADTSGDRLRLARLHYWMGRMHHLRNSARDAIGYYQQVLGEAKELGDEELMAVPSSFIGQALAVQGYFGKARPLLAQAIQPLEKTANWTEWLRAVAYLGNCLASRGQYKEGVAEGERALARAAAMKNPTAIALCHIYLMRIYLIGGDFERSLESVQTSLKTAEQTGDRVSLYVGFGFQSWVRCRLGQYQAARDNLAQSKSIGQTIGGRLLLGDLFGAVETEIAFRTGRTEEAVTLAEQAVAYAKGVDGIFALGLAERFWGEALAALSPNNFQDAEQHLDASVKAFGAGDSLLEAARVHMAWGLICRDRKNFSAAREHLQKTATQFESSGLSRELEQTQYLIAALQ